jgi:hypothetical protein
MSIKFSGEKHDNDQHVRDSSLDIATATGWTTEGSEFEAQQGQELSLLHFDQTGSGVHPTSY